MEQATAGNPKSSEPLIERVFGLAKASTDPHTEFVVPIESWQRIEVGEPEVVRPAV